MKTQAQNNTVLQKLQELRDHAWFLAMKYRYDPALGRAHEIYLKELNELLKAVNS